MTYTPNAGFSGSDAFTYTVEDAEGQEVSAIVTVTVTPLRRLTRDERRALASAGERYQRFLETPVEVQID